MAFKMFALSVPEEAYSRTSLQEYISAKHQGFTDKIIFRHVVKHGVESGVFLGVEFGVSFGVEFGVVIYSCEYIRI
jgi:hypothetical protein